MNLAEESLRNITIRKNKRNFRLSTTEDHRIISFNTETVSPTFSERHYPRIGDCASSNAEQPPVINDYEELNSILLRESEQRSVFSQDEVPRSPQNNQQVNTLKLCFQLII